MLRSFTLKNFRCFRELTLNSFNRINPIAGENNVGKTALLEAIHLHCDSSDSALPTMINQWRGIENPTKAFGEWWTWLFFDKNTTNRAELRSQDEQGKEHSVSLRLTDIATAQSGLHPDVGKPPGGFPGIGWHANSPCLVLKQEGSKDALRIVWVIGPNGEAWYTPAEAWRVPCEFLASRLSSAKRDVAHFSALKIEKRLSELLPSIQILEPRLVDLDLATIGDTSVVHGDIGLSRLVPVPLMGEGVGRLLSILLAIFLTPGGIILIDEIENGLHYSVQKKVWQAIGHACREAEVQVFATTHSWECIQAAHHAFKESGPYEMRYYRLDRIKDSIDVKSMVGVMLSRIDRSVLEIR